MTIDEQTLQQVVFDVCSGMLGLQLEPTPLLPCDDSDALSAVIRISGGWESLVQVLTPRRTAVAIASNMFAMSEDELSEEEIRDAVGEIVSTNSSGGCYYSANPTDIYVNQCSDSARVIKGA